MARLELHLLGPFQVILDGIPITGFDSAKVRALLAYIAAEAPRPQFRENLAEMLWPDWPQQSAMSNLRHALSNLRKNLGDRDAEVPYLLINRESIQLNPEGDIWIDTLALNEAESRADTGKISLPAAEFYRGPFLEGFSLAESADFQDWLLSKRAFYNQQILTLLDRCVAVCQETNDYSRGLELSRRALSIEPWREEFHQHIMRLLSLSGQRSAALAQYEECQRLLKKELGVTPSTETIQLYEEIRAGAYGGKANGQPAVSVDSHIESRSPVNNLTLHMTSFIGREREIAEILDMLRNHRLVTLTGSGGTGKTRLALQVARELLKGTLDGIWIVELASLVDPDKVLLSVAAALGLQGSGEVPVLEVVTNYLKPRAALIILDNCEHLVDACAHLAEHLLRTSPRLRILTTSRESIGLPGELSIRVPSLSLPSLEDEANADPVQLAQYEAIILFAERAALAQPGFKLSQANIRMVVQVCRRLDGIPLALELAAARTSSMSVEHIAARLNDRFRLLAGGSRTALPRQQTLRASIDWSYSLLTDVERILLQRLSVFAGGWTLEAAEKICGYGEVDSMSVVETLSALVRKSLVVFIEDNGRYRLLETIRQYLGEKLVADEPSRLEDGGQPGREAKLRRKHVDYYLQLFQQAKPELRGYRRGEWLDRLSAEIDNMRAALEYGLEDDPLECTLTGLELVWASSEFLKENGLAKEGLRWSGAYQARLEERESLSDSLKTRILFENAELLFRTGNYDGSQKLLEESIADFRRLDESLYFIRSISFYCHCFPVDNAAKQALVEEAIQIAKKTGLYENEKHELLFSKAWYLFDVDIDAGQRLLEESLAICEQNDWPNESIPRLRLLGVLAETRGDIPGALAYLQKALWRCRALKSNHSLIWILSFGGDLFYKIGNFSEMENYFHECQTVCEKLGFLPGHVWSLHHRAVALRHLGKSTPAMALALDSLDLAQEYQFSNLILEGISSLAGFMLDAGNLPDAVRLLAATQALNRQANNLGEIVLSETARDLKDARARMGEDGYQIAYHEGEEMSLEQAVKESRQAVLVKFGNFSMSASSYQ